LALFEVELLELWLILFLLSLEFFYKRLNSDAIVSAYPNGFS